MTRIEKERIELFVALRGLAITHRHAMSNDRGVLVHDSFDLARAEKLLASVDVSAAEVMSIHA
jgi:hypothetical protein